jgi:hypothetical protein
MDGAYALTVPLAFAGCFPVVVIFFMMLPARRAVITSFLFAWMFLPVAVFHITGFPDITKVSLTSISVLLAVSIFDFGRLWAFRPRWFDLALLVFCLSPLPSALSNGTGTYDGLSLSLSHVLQWGIPYFLGRIYFTDPAGLRDLTIGIFIGGLIYIPFCLFEVRMSPNLHWLVYGYHPHSFVQHARMGGWRPMVFMEHGIQVALWMATASLIGFGLWSLGRTKTFLGFPMPLLLFGLCVTLVLCKTVGALALFALGLASLIIIKRARSYLPLVALALIPLGYVAVRAPGFWDGLALVDIVEPVVGPERAQSLETRLTNENRLSAKAMERPIFGWGGWGASRVYTKSGQDVTLSDGLWIILFGMTGITSLLAFYIVVLGGPLRVKARIDPRLRFHPGLAPVIISAVCVLAWCIYNLPNSSRNPFFILMAGGLAGLKKVVPAVTVVRRVADSGASATATRVSRRR